MRYNNFSTGRLLKQKACLFIKGAEDGLCANCLLQEGGGKGFAQSVERATPSEEVLGSIPVVAARSLLVGSVSPCWLGGCQYNVTG